LFQEFVLGSDIFNTFYGLQPYMQVEGYLLFDDESTLSPKMHSQLLDWLKEPEQVVAIFTNRPSKPPPGYFDTPEAELGLKALKLEGLPLVGRGSMAWLAERRGMDPEALLKPSAVHVLAGLAHASRLSLQESLELSASLALEGQVDLIWQNLAGADVYVIEDSIKGLHSGKRARDLLLDVGIRIDLHLIGVSKSINKQQALRAAGAQQVFEDVNAVLEMIL
jgi:phosphoglycolate phosphatase-like HAD superfamily hydrolase